MQELVGEGDFREGDPSPGVAILYPPFLLGILVPASSLLAPSRQGIQDFWVLLSVSPEPHVVKEAKLWPTLRSFPQKVTEYASQLGA